MAIFYIAVIKRYNNAVLYNKYFYKKSILDGLAGNKLEKKLKTLTDAVSHIYF